MENFEKSNILSATKIIGKKIVLELSSNDNSSNGSSVSSLKSRLRNLPVPTLDERLAAFDRRLQCSEVNILIKQRLNFAFQNYISF